ncbi:hypothetical protein AL755_07815 [Arthrobacter sp. ERGS1:01]|uniref:hypothetical protein n=1 Tax=Arthrobacter sp. ERGS1:01 TaxID=1704044 RepID=UPI0006B4E190|nr:hypothetical protein [Arthrobacter sp. ERGS1:01]ALE05403.1 hypothetical protein AL755_07815 [Arthrobacter sp. ERGS1:01]
MREEPAGHAAGSGPTGDPAVDAVVARAGAAATLPTSAHNGLYAELLEDLQRELDADPAAVMTGGTAPGAVQ